MRTSKSLIRLYLLAATLALLPAAVLGCGRAFLTNQLGDNQSYSCYLAGQSANYCYYDCYLM
jgi:hypothetical protein